MKARGYTRQPLNDFPQGGSMEIPRADYLEAWRLYKERRTHARERPPPGGARRADGPPRSSVGGRDRARAAPGPPHDETHVPDVPLVLGAPDDPRLAGAGHGRRPGDRTARGALPRGRRARRGLSVRRRARRGLNVSQVLRRRRRRLQGSAPPKAGIEPRESAAVRVLRGLAPCGSPPAGASSRRAPSCAGGSTPASPRRTRRHG